MMPYMDKQIMDLSQQQNKDFIDLKNHSHDDELRSVDSINKEEIVPSYDFQQIRPFTASSASPSTNLDGVHTLSRVWNSSDSYVANNTTAAPVKSYSPLDSTEPSKLIPEKDQFAVDVNIISEIDKAMKKHVDNLLHVLQNFSAQLTQMESRTRYLENSMDELKVSIGNNHGNTDGKLRQLENILTEVQSGVQVLKDKQETVEAQLQLEKLKVSKIDQQSISHKSPHVESIQPATLAQPAYGHLPPPSNPSLSMPSLPSSDAVTQLSTQQNLPASVQLPNPFPPNPVPPISQPLRESYFPPPSPAQETLNSQYQLTPNQQRHSSPSVPLPQQYLLSSPEQYSQLQHHQQRHRPSPLNPSQSHPSLGPQAEETPYIPSQNYQPNLRQKPPQPPTGPSLAQEFYGVPPLPYEPPSGRTTPGFSSSYGQPSGPPGESYHYGRTPSAYSTSPPTLKPQLSSSINAGRGGYPQLPTARVLPHVLPTAGGVSGGSGSAGTGSGNRVPADEIVDKVASMGFSRDLAISTIRKLAENGQSVDLNIVLDKLMNEGEAQPSRSWPFGR